MQASHSRVQKKDEDPLGPRDTETQEAGRKKATDSVVARKFTFSASERLRRTADFDRVYSEGKRVASSALALFFSSSPTGGTRMGLSVSKRIGQAVVRNRIKRLLREAFRLNKHNLKKGYDILLVAREGIQGLKYAQVEALALALFSRGGLLVEEQENRGDVPPVRSGG